MYENDFPRIKQNRRICENWFSFSSHFKTLTQSTSSLECSVLRVIIPNEYNGSIQSKTIPVRPHMTTRDVCRIIAHKSQITNPMDYGLFKLSDGEGKYLIKQVIPSFFLVTRFSPFRVPWEFLWNLMIYSFSFCTCLLIFYQSRNFIDG